MPRLRRSEPPLDRYLNAWALETAGRLIETHTSWLLPVRHADGPAMLKLLKPDSDEHAGAALLRYFAGIGAVRLLADAEGARLLERADSDPSLAAIAVTMEPPRPSSPNALRNSTPRARTHRHQG
jgi:streptomycin 6-kinase